MKNSHVKRLPVFRMLLAGAMLGLISGCAERHVPRTEYFPLRDGNRWEYRLLDKPLLGRLQQGQAITTAPFEEKPGAAINRDDSDLAPKAEVVEPAKEKKDDDEKSAVARRVVLELRAAVDELTFRALYDTAEQVWSKRNGYIGFQSARGRSYLLILPPHSGYKWVVTGPGGQDLFYEIESASASVTTPAGEFRNCAVSRQESRDRKEIFRYWFAPEVGLVRRSKYFMNEEVFRQELIEFNIKPATPATRQAEDREVRKAVEGKNRGSEFRDAKSERARRGEDDSKSEDVNDKVQKHSDPK
ncbi:MAG TPA: hypothetical protein VEJ63_21565 [Planctomycetota bacterium]|nr:hypothetical protein [Planctomycetota bacterium]